MLECLTIEQLLTHLCLECKDGKSKAHTLSRKIEKHEIKYHRFLPTYLGMTDINCTSTSNKCICTCIKVKKLQF